MFRKEQTMNKEELSKILYALTIVFGDNGVDLFDKILTLLK